MFVSGSPMNYSRWENPEYDALLEAAKMQSPAERFASLESALDMVMEGSAYLPIYYYTDPIMVSETVSNWEKTSRNTWFFGFAEMVE
jgi:oligopeptide transport system substrate-binding protein